MAITYTAFLADGTIWAQSTNYDKLAARFEKHRTSILNKTGVWIGGQILSYH